jgi:uncharacterized membrane protein YqiK
MNVRRQGFAKWMIVAAVVIVALLIVLGVSSQHFYLFERLDSQEIGVRFRGGRIHQVVGPGVYSDVAWFARIEKVSIEAITFSVSDPEVVTKDRQRVGFVVSGDVFRPSIGEGGIYERLWPQYRNLYLYDEALQIRVTDLALQALKSCVGDRTFNDNVIGSSRDELRVCIDAEVNRLAGALGLTVKNVAIPNVILSPDVQASLDAITQARLDTELAAQDAIKAKEQSTANQAREEGEVRVTLARQQEEVRQQTILAELQRQKLEANRAVIEAEKANDLLTAQKDLEINAAKADAAKELARADLALDTVRAELYRQNPDFAYLEALRINAAAIAPTDKLIFTQEGTTPTIVVPGAGIMPTVETAPSDNP